MWSHYKILNHTESQKETLVCKKSQDFNCGINEIMSLKIFIGLDLVVTREKIADKITVHTLFRFSPYSKYYGHRPYAPLGPVVGVSTLFCKGLLQARRLAMTFGFWSSLQEGLCQWVSLSLSKWPVGVILTHFLTHFKSLFFLHWSEAPCNIQIHYVSTCSSYVFFFFIAPKINIVQLHARISLTNHRWIVHHCIVSSVLFVPCLLVPLCLNSSVPCPVYSLLQVTAVLPHKYFSILWHYIQAVHIFQNKYLMQLWFCCSKSRANHL